MKSITSILAIVAVSTTFALADDKPAPAADPAAPAPATTPATTTTPAAPETTPAKPKHDPAEVFKKLNKAGDGKLTLEEFLASKHAQQDPDKAKAQFKKLDKDGKGFVTLEEFSAAREKKAAQ